MTGNTWIKIKKTIWLITGIINAKNKRNIEAKNEGSRTIYHRETKMIHAKSNKGYVWDNRKRAQKPKSVN